MADSEHTQPKIRGPRMLVMGVGSSGARAVDKMAGCNAALRTVAIDTDAKVLEEIKTAESIHVGQAVTRGLSAGGDVELGRQSIEKDSSSIRQLLARTDLLLIAAGLGGGTGSGAVPVITRLARETGTLVLCMVSTPFAFEGKKISRVSEESIKRIRTHADAIVRLNNEMLVERSDGDIPMEVAFTRSHTVVCDGILSLWRMISENGVCGLDFASIHTMLRNCDGFCHFASTQASGAGRARKVADGLLHHPLLNKGKMLGKAAGMIVGLTGSSNLMLSEVEEIMNLIQEKLTEETWVNFGVVINPAAGDELSAVALLAEEWREALVDSGSRQMSFSDRRRLPLEQGELPLETAGKGSFASLDPTIHEHQDLDVPTYIRRSIKLPR